MCAVSAHGAQCRLTAAQCVRVGKKAGNYPEREEHDGTFVYL